MIPGGGLHRLPGDIDGDQDPLSLKPLGSEAVFVIGPLSLGDNAPGCGLENDRPQAEFIECEHASPFRRVSKGRNRVRQHR